MVPAEDDMQIREAFLILKKIIIYLHFKKNPAVNSTFNFD